MVRLSFRDPHTDLWEEVIGKDKINSAFSILFTFHQLPAGMWCGDRDYLLYLRICVLGRSQTMVFRSAEGGACSWTSSTSWLRHKNAKQWRRDKRWYRDISRKNASTVWPTISIFCEFLFFILCGRTSYRNFLRFPLALCTGHQLRNTLTNWLKPWLQRKRHLYVDSYFLYNNSWFKLAYRFRFFLMHPQVPQYRSNWWKESNHQVWEW